MAYFSDNVKYFSYIENVTETYTCKHVIIDISASLRTFKVYGYKVYNVY